VNNTVARPSAPARKPNRRPGATIPDSPARSTVVQFADRAARKRADRFAAAYRREQARTGALPVRAAT